MLKIIFTGNRQDFDGTLKRFNLALKKGLVEVLRNTRNTAIHRVKTEAKEGVVYSFPFKPVHTSSARGQSHANLTGEAIKAIHGAVESPFNAVFGYKKSLDYGYRLEHKSELGRSTLKNAMQDSKQSNRAIMRRQTKKSNYLKSL